MAERPVLWFLFGFIGAAVLLSVILAVTTDSTRYERNGVDQRNHKRDVIECEAKGGFTGGGAYDLTCFDVDSIIPLTGPREVVAP